jgi:hypothetical protein
MKEGGSIILDGRGGVNGLRENFTRRSPGVGNRG